MKQQLKFITISALLSLVFLPSAKADSAFAPLGFSEMKNKLLDVSSPDRSMEMSFTLRAPSERLDFNLVLQPEKAFDVQASRAVRGQYRVRVIDYELIYDMDRYHNTNGRLIDFNRTNQIRFLWSQSGTVLEDPDRGSFVECQISIGFTRGRTTLDLDLLELLTSTEDFTYGVQFNRSILNFDEEESFKRNQFVFTRRNNAPASVELTVRDGSGSVYYQNSQEVPACPSSSTTRPRPRDPSRTPTPAPPSRDTSSEMTDEQRAYLRGQVTVSFGQRSNRLFSREFSIQYTAGLSNPFNRTIKCDITLRSGVGVSRWEAVDVQSHRGVVVPPKGTTKVNGTIRAKKGPSGTQQSGLEWANYREQRPASNCTFL